MCSANLWLLCLQAFKRLLRTRWLQLPRNLQIGRNVLEKVKSLAPVKPSVKPMVLCEILQEALDMNYLAQNNSTCYSRTRGLAVLMPFVDSLLGMQNEEVTCLETYSSYLILLQVGRAKFKFAKSNAWLSESVRA